MKITTHTRITKLPADVGSGTKSKIARALNRTSRQVREELVRTLRTELDRPKPFTLNAFAIRPANSASLESTVFAMRIQDAYISRLITGGRRNLKPFEKNSSVQGFGTPGAGSALDQYGNVPRSVILKGLAGTGGYFVKTSHGKPIGIFKSGNKNLKPIMMFRHTANYKPQLDLIGPVVGQIPAIFKAMFAAESNT